MFCKDYSYIERVFKQDTLQQNMTIRSCNNIEKKRVKLQVKIIATRLVKFVAGIDKQLMKLMT